MDIFLIVGCGFLAILLCGIACFQKKKIGKKLFAAIIPIAVLLSPIKAYAASVPMVMAIKGPSDWIFDSLVSWVASKISSLGTELISWFVGFFAPDITLFATVVPGYASFAAAFKIMGYSLCVLIVLMALIGTATGVITERGEDPFRIVARFSLSLVMIAFSYTIVNLIYQLGIKGANVILSQMEGAIAAGINSENAKLTFSKAMEYIMNGGGLSGGMTIIYLVLYIMIIWNIFKLLIEVAERYVWMCLLYTASPLAFATCASGATSNICSNYMQMLGSQMLVFIINTWMMGLLALLLPMLAISRLTGFAQMSVHLFYLAIAKGAIKIDNYLNDMGLSVARTGSGLVGSISSAIYTGGLTGARMAGNIFSKHAATPPGAEHQAQLAGFKSYNAARNAGTVGTDGKIYSTMGARTMADSARMNNGYVKTAGSATKADYNSIPGIKGATGVAVSNMAYNSGLMEKLGKNGVNMEGASFMEQGSEFTKDGIEATTLQTADGMMHTLNSGNDMNKVIAQANLPDVATSFAEPILDGYDHLTQSVGDAPLSNYGGLGVGETKSLGQLNANTGMYLDEFGNAVGGAYSVENLQKAGINGIDVIPMDEINVTRNPDNTLSFSRAGEDAPFALVGTNGTDLNTLNSIAQVSGKGHVTSTGEYLTGMNLADESAFMQSMESMPAISSNPITDVSSAQAVFDSNGYNPLATGGIVTDGDGGQVEGTTISNPKLQTMQPVFDQNGKLQAMEATYSGEVQSADGGSVPSTGTFKTSIPSEAIKQQFGYAPVSNMESAASAYNQIAGITTPATAAPIAQYAHSNGLTVDANTVSGKLDADGRVAFIAQDSEGKAARYEIYNPNVFRTENGRKTVEIGNATYGIYKESVSNSYVSSKEITKESRLRKIFTSSQEQNKKETAKFGNKNDKKNRRRHRF